MERGIILILIYAFLSILLLWYTGAVTALEVPEKIPILEYHIKLNGSSIDCTYEVYYGTFFNRTEEGDYTIRILNEKNELLSADRFKSVDFLYTNPPVLMNTTHVMKRTPFSPEMKYLELVKNGVVVFRKELEFCNHNGKCEPDRNENVLTCEDCTVLNDEMCLPRYDKICDPDCINYDPDCLREKTRIVDESIRRSTKEGSIVDIGVYFVVGIITILSVFYLIIRFGMWARRGRRN